MLAGRPHEAVGNDSPRWMTAAPRKRAHRTRPTGRLTPFHVADLGRNGTTFTGSVPVPSEPPRRSRRWPTAEVFYVGEEVPVGVHRLSNSGRTEPSLKHLGLRLAAIGVEA
jgi:hypothetical protein